MKEPLVIAPQVGLTMGRAEVDALVNTIGAEQMSYDVTLSRLSEYDWRGRDLLVFVAHGDASGIEVEGGRVGLVLLQSFVREAGATVVILNSCSSRQIAEQIYARTGAHVIATLCDVADIEAFRVSLSWARQFVATGDARQAYEMVRTESYVYIPERLEMMTPQEPDVTLAEFTRLYRLIAGDPLGPPGLLSDIRALTGEIHGLRKDMQNIKVTIWWLRLILSMVAGVAAIEAFWIAYLFFDGRGGEGGVLGMAGLAAAVASMKFLRIL